jgi:hypothetical protein
MGEPQPRCHADQGGKISVATQLRFARVGLTTLIMSG